MYRSRPWGWYPQKPGKQEQNRRKPTQTSTHLGHGEPSRYTSGCHTCGSGRRGPRRRRPRRYRPPWCRGADGGAHEDLRGVASTCWSVSSIAEKLTVVCKVAGFAVFLHACKLVVSHLVFFILQTGRFSSPAQSVRSDGQTKCTDFLSNIIWIPSAGLLPEQDSSPRRRIFVGACWFHALHRIADL